MKRLKPLERKQIIEKIWNDLSFNWLTHYGLQNRKMLVKELARKIRLER